MFGRLRYYWGIGWHYLRLAIQAQMEYPAFLAGWLITNPMQVLVGVLTIYFTVQNFGSLGGWSFAELAFLLGIASVSHGISVILFIQTWHIKWMALEGEFDRLLVRPLNVFFQFCLHDFNLIGITDFLPGLAVLIWGCQLTGFSPDPFNIIKLLAAVAGAVLIRGAVFLGCGSIPLYAQGANSMEDLNMKLFSYTSQYPLSIYPRALQAIFTFVLPLGFISFYPASEFLGKQTAFLLPGGLWLGSLLTGAALFAVAYVVFHYGLKRYSSAGS